MKEFSVWEVEELICVQINVSSATKGQLYIWVYSTDASSDTEKYALEKLS